MLGASEKSPLERGFLLLLGAAVLAAGAMVTWQVSDRLNQVMVAGIFMLFLAVMAVLKPQTAVLATLTFLALLGDLRRLVDIEAGKAESDPILMIGPGIAALLIVTAKLNGRVNLDSRASKLILGLMGFMFLQVFNPLQGGLKVGFGGILFHMVPLLWFWVGQAYGSERLLETLFSKIVIPLCVVASAFGLYQSFFGPLPWQQAWVDAVSGQDAAYTALNVGDRIRPFAYFTSSAEFAHYLAIGSGLIVAAAIARRPGPAVILLPLFLTAGFLQGARAVLLFLIAGLVLIWVVNTKNAALLVPRLVAGGLAGVMLLTVGLSGLLKNELPDVIAPVVEHQVEGITDPLNEKKSTANVHLTMILDGIRTGTENPLGYGLGSSTMAATKLNGRVGGTEFDISNVWVSCGIGGAALYLVIIYTLFSSTIRYYRKERAPVALAVFGIMAIEFGEWLMGGQYAVAALVWFSIGSLDRIQHPDPYRRLEE